jgi:hypothetical protein
MVARGGVPYREPGNLWKWEGVPSPWTTPFTKIRNMKNKIFEKSKNNFKEGTRYKRKVGEKVSLPAHVKIKQRKVFDTWVKNGMRDMRGAILSAGYSESTARVPSVITRSATWKELMTEYFPDSLLTKKHLELLNQRDVVSYHEKIWDRKIGKYVKIKVFKDLGVNVTAVSKGLELAYKIKGVYKGRCKNCGC